MYFSPSRVTILRLRSFNSGRQPQTSISRASAGSRLPINNLLKPPPSTWFELECCNGCNAHLRGFQERETSGQPRSSEPITQQRCPTSSSRARNEDDERKFTLKLERLAALPSL